MLHRTAPHRRGIFPILLLLSFCLLPAAAAGDDPHPFAWNRLAREAYPGAFWWWLGSAVNEAELEREIKSLAEVGIKTLRLDAIYRGEDSAVPTIDYLSDPWIGSLKTTARLCRAHDVQLDLWGNGWPMGGPWIKPQHAARRLTWDEGTQGISVHEPLVIEQDAGDPIFSVSISPRGDSGHQPARVLAPETIGGKPVWKVPTGEWDLHIFRNGYTKMDVKRAPPGGAGPVMDHLNQEALQDWFAAYDRLLAAVGEQAVVVTHNDSYEVYRANWTGKFVPFFQARRGYDVQPYLPALISDADTDLAQRIRHDFRQTVQELLRDEMMKPWVQWAHGQGMKTSYQAHGSPGHLVDLYGLADQPDTEAFGRSGMANDGTGIGSGYICSKFASSAAHLNGNRMTSAETFTWLEDHFCTSLDRMRREVDYYFLAGVNRMYFHSATFSPADVPFPGWLYYASVNVDSCQTWWKHLHHLNNYIARVQSVLQQGAPGEDVLLLYPGHDLWFDNENSLNFLQYCQVHNTPNWLHRAAKSTQETAQWLWDRGWTFDWCSDLTICDSLRVEEGQIVAGDGRYRALVIPPCNWVNATTPAAIRQLAEEGARVLFVGSPPQPVPTGEPATSLPNWNESQRKGAFTSATSAGHVSFLKSTNELSAALRDAGALREAMTDQGLWTIRRRQGNAYTYFIRNVQAQDFAGWVPLPGLAAAGTDSLVIGDPVSGDQRVIAGKVRSGTYGAVLHLPASRSCVVRASTRQPTPRPARRAASHKRAIAIQGPWQLVWRDQQDPQQIHRVDLPELCCWTDLDQLRHYSGTVAYETTFVLPARTSAWQLDLGALHESADISINGKPAGCIWTTPYTLDVGPVCRAGKNTLRIEVTNLTANRVIALEQSGVHLKDRHFFVDYEYRPFDPTAWEPLPSGLLGPVSLHSDR